MNPFQNKLNYNLHMLADTPQYTISWRISTSHPLNNQIAPGSEVIFLFIKKGRLNVVILN